MPPLHGAVTFGASIAFASSRGGAGSHIFIMNADGGFQTKLSMLSVKVPPRGRDLVLSAVQKQHLIKFLKSL